MTKGKTRKTSRTKRTTGTRQKAKTARKVGTSPLLKYEIIGICCILAGVFATAGFIGVDTGRIGHSVDDILAYIFGLGRIVVSLSLIVLGLKYIVIRKACPVSKSWAVGTWIYILLLGLVHLLVIPEGTEFLPHSLSVGGGIVGAVMASVLRRFLGFFGAVMAITGACIVTFLVWKNWSISKPVAVVADKAGQEAAKVSGKAVEGLQDASQSLKQWHERRRIFDLQAVVGDDPLGRPACGNPDDYPADMERPASTIADARDLGNGVEEVRFDASPIEEDVPTIGPVMIRMKKFRKRRRKCRKTPGLTVRYMKPLSAIQCRRPMTYSPARQRRRLRWPEKRMSSAMIWTTSSPLKSKEQRRCRNQRRREQCRSQSGWRKDVPPAAGEHAQTGAAAYRRPER